MNTPVSASIKTINNVSSLLAQVVNSFAQTLELKALVLVCFVLALLFKFGLGGRS